MRGKHGSFTYLFNSEFFLGRRVTEVQTVNKPKESGGIEIRQIRALAADSIVDPTT